MGEISDNLLLRLQKKGLMDVEIQRLIKDVINITNKGGTFTVSTVNARLRQLGWDNNVIDELIFEQIMSLRDADEDISIL
ncbi:MAG: hypothetical protein GY749_29140 [Desulfobacteraceae bacterium]|nr:hypothetical protein [Desulfobacteraceae bacterium]